MHPSIMIALSRPTSDAEEEAFNRWYDAVHLPEVAALPGVISARRYKVADVPPPPGITLPSHPYLAIYELAAGSEAELRDFMNVMSGAIAAGRFDMSGPIAMDDAGAMLAMPIGRPVNGGALP